MGQFDAIQKLPGALVSYILETPLSVLVAFVVALIAGAIALICAAVYVLAPTPRAALESEKRYITTEGIDGAATKPAPLPCWLDGWYDHRRAYAKGIASNKNPGSIDEPWIQMSVVIPAYNEEERLELMLEEAVEFLDKEYGRQSLEAQRVAKEKDTLGTSLTRRNVDAGSKPRAPGLGGYEILIVNDGSTDRTVEVALEFSRKHELHDILRICTLEQNRGKGGAVTHGFRHVRGKYVIFADADGASKFEDLRKLVEGCDAVADISGRGIAVGSRAHLVGSESVVKRSMIRNTLMHSFHLLLRLLTPPATSRIRDTQCGFKLFSRAALPHIIPYMHAEGWIFDVEMLMLAESAPLLVTDALVAAAPRPGIRVAEVPIGWQEIGGSKLNVMWDSLGMAWGLAILRAGWGLGVYRRQ